MSSPRSQLRRFRLLLILWIVVTGPCGRGSFAAVQPILTNSVHLGLAEKPEWDLFFAPPRHDPKYLIPQGTNLVIHFQARRNEHEGTLIIRQDDVKQDWSVSLNGKRVGQLFLMEADLIYTLPIEPGLLRDGANELRIFTRTPEDILLHRIEVAGFSRAELENSGPVEIQVTARSNGRGLPSRVTIFDENGSLAAVRDLSGTNVAVRPGVIYTAHGRAVIAVRPGQYSVYATRGPEYSRAEGRFTVEAGESRTVRLELERTVDTSGWVASDTHIHTLELSRHGDALLAERMMTIAGEGIDLPVSTEHNQHADYLPAAKSLSLDTAFTVLPGNEVTTPVGHFNIFPVPPGATPVNAAITNWPTLWKEMRAIPGVEVIILNHPTDTHSRFTPFAVTNFNRLTGRNLRGDFPFQFDAMEVINSGAMRTDWMEPFQCWFALLNRGYRITGVGASDSHDVSRFIVGQGRTYIRVDDRDPQNIDVRAACESLKAGKAIVSLGLFPQLRVRIKNQSGGPGDLVRARGDEIELTGTVDWPRWMSPTNDSIYCTVHLYANGREIENIQFSGVRKSDRRVNFSRRLRRPRQDTWFVAIAEAPGVTSASWAVARPYQPTSPRWTPVLLGATNPIRVDADDDGRFTPPREYAAALVKRFGGSASDLLSALIDYDWATAVQTAELLDMKQVKIRSLAFADELKKTSGTARRAFQDYLNVTAR